ncbi:nucleotidyltransferase domain-containing protein [Brunnivagina elsteri]|uniref:Nucleotidyltransferase n=1 Tax=Brunnivagina elsteri CCALA 953 TaxID=987040 RepID=A0A2A2TDF3_9CYAN|nr:hypothetical protein [Calothrix elsteri]PAX51780.1 hypothetical protein CK510_22920 [Calothrix elsteri CCALA 953]
MNSVISDNHIKALKQIIPIFHQNNITYRITGGLAGNLYGSQWLLHDIDIEVAQKDMNKIEDLFQEYIAIALMRLVDDEFDLRIMTLEIEHIDVEINQAEEAFVFHNDLAVPLNHDLSIFNLIIFEKLELRVQPLDEIIKDKELIGRKKDLVDLRQLQENF